MRKYNILSIIVVVALAVVSCSKWTETERITYDNQDVKKLVHLIEAQKESDLNPHMREYYKKLREEYRTRPRVKGFGWFGNWTGKGDNPQNYLRCLPDSVDFVSLWGARGKLSEEQKTDLKFFQEVKGGKALLCWIVQDLGGPLTPVGKDRIEYWQNEKGGGNFNEGVRAYANAIADTIEKYNLDGFDIDFEPAYGHAGDLANVRYIGDIKNDNPMQIFIETLSGRLRPKGRMLVMDGEPYYLSNETSKLVDHYIYQAYWEQSTNAVTWKIEYGENLDNWERKTIITVEFERNWRTGGVSGYRSVRSELNDMKGTQILDYATFDLPSGKRIGGVGSYHMEYDYANTPEYKWLRKALYYGNQKYPGNYQ
ncbi:endoglycosidase [Capnocytophaga sp. Marseille-Q4570]|uniref:Endoglycosidase n=1 Tax=Capnocytophaga bilenii TaxID=2819369 RepID=A0ABS3PX25_9FLAO|nr:endo-beta-N-acetylglucosaminidase family protein [Capnocytophaga bilenii]MBO1883868.1 endoglycosidase [Capnocytophaga bilenii]